MEKDKNINVEQLRLWLEEEQPVFVLDVRPVSQRDEWFIPGSTHLDAYEKLNKGDFSILDEVDIPDNTKVVTVCAAGRTSQLASNSLKEKGYDAYSLEGGMKAWSLAWNKATIQTEAATIVQLRRTGKGCLSYIVGSENEALVIDASLNIAVYREVADSNGWQIKYVLDTHIHADHLSRSASLAQETGATLLMPEQDKLKYPYTPITGDFKIEFGNSVLTAIKTPGHTLESTTFLLNNTFLFTGDTLFVDGVGRPDLKASEEDVKKRAALLYQSLQNMLSLPQSSVVLPGHISKPIKFDERPIEATLEEIRKNVSILTLSEDDFIETILNKIPPTPPNYLQITEVNLTGDIRGIDATDIEAGANRCAIS